MSTPLKHFLVDHPEPAWKVAAQAGMSDVRLSKLARGASTPRDWEMAALSDILGKSPKELFPEPKSPVVA